MKTLSTLYVTLGVLPVWCLKCHAGLRAWVVYRLVILGVVQICVFWDGILVCDAGTRCHIQEGKRGGLGFV